jgi:hypothetical protein
MRSVRLPSATLVLVVLAAAALLVGSRAARAEAEQHVWLHYDYMVGPGGESYAPDPAGIQIVVDAFKRHGVILHIDPQHTAIPLHEAIVFDPPPNPTQGCPGDSVNFSSLKAQYFHPTSDHPWHYAIFGTEVEFATRCQPLSVTGYSLLPGYDFVVTLGGFFDYGSGLDCFYNFSNGDPLPCWPVPDYEWATVFMHELGHNLGLRHGGDVETNYKPNYVSVMNYLYSFNTPIIAASSDSGSGYSYRVDYSDETLPPLDERNLDETAGIGPTAHPTDYIQWCCQFNGFQSAGGPIDWNTNGTATDTGISADLNNDGGLTVLRGFDDWAEVHQYLADEDQHPKRPQLATP